MGDNDSHQMEPEPTRVPTGLIISGLIIIALAIFVAQNTEDVQFNFLTFEFTLPLWLVLVVVFVLGAAVGQGVGWIRRRRKRRAER